MSPEGTVGLLVGADAGTLLLIAPDAVVPSLGLKPAIRGSVASNNFPATLLNGFLAFLLFAGALQVNSADLLTATAPVSEFLPAQLIWLDNCHRARKLGRCRELLSMAPVAPADPPAHYRDRH